MESAWYIQDQCAISRHSVPAAQKFHSFHERHVVHRREFPISITTFHFNSMSRIRRNLAPPVKLRSVMLPRSLITPSSSPASMGTGLARPAELKLGTLTSSHCPGSSARPSTARNSPAVRVIPGPLRTSDFPDALQRQSSTVPLPTSTSRCVATSASAAGRRLSLGTTVLPEAAPASVPSPILSAPSPESRPTPTCR